MDRGFRVYIRDNNTREIRVYQENHDWDDSYIFQWAEGNYSCDCNRELFFGRACGEERWGKTECGQGRFSISIALPSGEVVYSEEDLDG